jgi:lipoprotein-releasing system permease protein
MNVSAMIGLRYYRARSDNRFISLISMVSFLGLVLGVVALIIVVSVMNGFDRELKLRILGAVPHLLVNEQTVDGVRAMSGDFPVKAITPYIDAQMVLITARGNHLITVQGIDPGSEALASTIPDSMTVGSIADLVPGVNGIVLGQGFLRRSGLNLGETVTLVLPRVSAAGATVVPEIFNARVVGSYSLGSQVDYQLGVMHLDDLQALAPGPVKVRVTFFDIFSAPVMRAALLERGVNSIDWTDAFGDFFRTVRMEKIMMFVLLSFVVTIASFSIVSGLTMLVESKRRDIAVLRTMGLSEAGVLGVFLVQGVSISLLGVLAGLLIGIPLAFFTPAIMASVESWIGFSIVEGTYFDQIPVDLRSLDITVIAVATFCIGFLATLYPSFRASRLHPAEVLRYE